MINLFNHQDLLFNTKTGNGLLIAKLKNYRNKLKKNADFEDSNDSIDTSTTSTTPNGEDIDEDSDDFEADVRFLKNAVLPLQLEAAKARLKRSFSYRRGCISSGLKIRIDYPYFFQCPELVMIFFSFFIHFF
jgi:hypothetical protein